MYSASHLKIKTLHRKSQVNAYMVVTVDDIRRSIQNGFVLGNTEFRDQVERITGTPQPYQMRG